MIDDLHKKILARPDDFAACSAATNFSIFSSDSRRLTFLKEAARSPEQLCVTTGNLYHSLCQ